MGAYYENEKSILSETPKWSPKLNLLELTSDMTGAMESLKNCLEMDLMKTVSIQVIQIVLNNPNDYQFRNKLN